MRGISHESKYAESEGLRQQHDFQLYVKGSGNVVYADDL